MLRVLDTTTYTLETSFNDSLKYTVSSAVTAFIGGDGDGNAKVTGPQSDFNFTALNTIFSEAIGAAKNNSSPTQTPSSTSKSNTGTIAGGVVARVAGLAILAGIAYFFFRRKKRVDEFKERSNGWENSAPPAEYKSPMVNESSEGAELPGHQMYSRPVEVDGRGLCEMRPPFEMTG
jgi:LPXTG-motif cell wall-anchored protein